LPLATNMVVVATYWLSFEYVRNPRNFAEGEVVARGAFQVMSMVAPFLRGASRALSSGSRMNTRPVNGPRRRREERAMPKGSWSSSRIATRPTCTTGLR